MSINETIRAACLEAIAKGIKVKKGGAWFNTSTGKVTECCAIGAVLLTDETFKPHTEVVEKLGYTEKAIAMLEVGPSWLYRFWMGFDRNYQIMIISKDGKNESKDDVSAFGIQLANEMMQAQKQKIAA